MKKQFRNFSGDELKTNDYVSMRLNGSIYASGEIESLSASSDNLRDAFGKLAAILLTKKILTEEEIIEIVGGSDTYDYR